MNIHEKPSLEKQLADCRFALSQVSHEIRNPVTLINSSLQLLEKEHPDLKQSDLWGNIMEDMRFLRCLLDDLSSYNNTFRCTKKETNMTSWLKELTSSIPLLFPDKQCLYSVHIPENLPAVSIDPLKMHQALTNLLRNAFEAAEFAVSFRSFEQEGQLFMEISNDGTPVSADKLETIFQPFVTTKSEGTGLGLPIAKGILEAHGGSLSLTSSKSQGTTVRICLPAH